MLHQHKVYEMLKERFNQLDGSRTFKLQKLQHYSKEEFISVYFTKLKALWDEFEALVPSLECECEKERGFVNHLNRQNLYQFLMGLNEFFRQEKSQILLISQIPSVN